MAIIAAIVVMVGIWSFSTLEINAIPDVTGVQVQINTTVPSLAPEEIDHLATLPIERAMAASPGSTRSAC